MMQCFASLVRVFGKALFGGRERRSLAPAQTSPSLQSSISPLKPLHRQIDLYIAQTDHHIAMTKTITYKMNGSREETLEGWGIKRGWVGILQAWNRPDTDQRWCSTSLGMMWLTPTM